MKLRIILISAIIMISNLLFAKNFETDTFKTKSNKEVVITFIKHG